MSESVARVGIAMARIDQALADEVSYAEKLRESLPVTIEGESARQDTAAQFTRLAMDEAARAQAEDCKRSRLGFMTADELMTVANRAAVNYQRVSAVKILEDAAQAIRDRAAIRDLPNGERSSAHAGRIFEAITGKPMSEGESWIFLIALKLARSQAGAFHLDDWTDAAAYCALAAEHLANDR